jgi:hypothetical protein
MPLKRKPLARSHQDPGVTDITESELRLLGIPTGSTLPPGGLSVIVRVASGHGSASHWTDLFAPVFEARFGVRLHGGSLNLWAPGPLEWPEPESMTAPGITGEFCPIILAETAVGVAFRGNRDEPEYLEVLSPVFLRPRLGNVQDGELIAVRLLPGRLLKRAG